MCTSSDSNTGSRQPGDEARADWMALLARAPLDLLETALEEHLDLPVHWLRRPETGLMMVQARTGGTGARFHLGEVTVTRCALRLERGTPAGAVGVAYVLGRSLRHAELAALGDALLQQGEHHDGLQARLLAPVRHWLAQTRAGRASVAATTRVDFFTVAREAGGNADDAAESGR